MGDEIPENDDKNLTSNKEVKENDPNHPTEDWLKEARSELHGHHHGQDEDSSDHADMDDGDEELIEDETDVRRVLSLLEQQRRLRVTDKQNHALKEARLHAQEHLFSGWKEHHHDYSEDEEERVKDFDQNHRLELLWTQRHTAVNYTLAILFHVVVVLNFVYCFWESFGILIEEAKFHYIYLRDQYQCLDIVPSHDSFSHFVSIFHALTCVAVLHAKTLQTANLCWAFLFGTTLHFCFKVYEMLFNERFEHDETVRGYEHQRLIQLCVVVIIQMIAIIVILQRYYDLTARFQKRTHKFVTQTYEGRQLNDRIIYRNVSSFVQRKYVLRSCTALQIYNTVQKMQVYKKKLKKGEKVSDELFARDVRNAVVALKEVEGFQGMAMMKELKRKHYEDIKEEYELGDPGAPEHDGNDDRVEEILDEIKDV